jgi:hypothetical protein
MHSPLYEISYMYEYFREYFILIRLCDQIQGPVFESGAVVENLRIGTLNS